jgi:hypothetical protein
MTTTNKVLAQPAQGDLTWDVPLNTNFLIIDKALGGTATIDVTGVTATPVTLTSGTPLYQYQNLIIAFIGTLTANVTYQVPSGVGGQWIITSAATGAFTITFKTAAVGGATVTIPVSVTGVTVYSDGTNVYLTGGGGATGGGVDQVFFQNSQVVTTSYTITTGKNAMSAGPITINSGVTVTIPSGSVWTIV